MTESEEWREKPGTGFALDLMKLPVTLIDTFFTFSYFCFMDRLDKILSSSGLASRKEAAMLVRKGRVKVNGIVASRVDIKVRESDEITLDDVQVERFRPVLIAMNKPLGYVTSTDGKNGRTVMELLPEKYLKLGVKPVGRLDKETSGLLLFTNDGNLLHSLISPKREIEKEYIVSHKGKVTDEIIRCFREGVTLGDGTVCREAVLVPIKEGEAALTITEGKYHQVRRMMAVFGLDVIALKRVREGSVTLSGLEEGKVKELHFPTD